jgi:hypothetical protein
MSSQQMSFWANVFLGKCPSGQVSSGQMSFWANAFLGKCLMGKCLSRQMSYGQMSIWANVFLGKCLYVQMLFWANVSGQMLYGQMSYHRLTHNPPCPVYFIFIFQVKSAAALLLESKMFYVPFLLNSSID